ncbi:hypothetical protein GYA27_02830 [candidate division WWE3 bacterium]|uniref:Uncharacterized protein n=1 Tax=candidate division WWE3 bacterium TaxID=2053526 RepID=A0A7X9DKJ4_UNCKA|nr:hypothetical protein [candidate division WWE3 bacterium]
MKKSVFVVVVLAIILATVLSSCAPTPVAEDVVEETVQPEESFEGTLELMYIFGNTPEWMDITLFPSTQEVPIKFNPEKSWSTPGAYMLQYQGVELFGMELGEIPEDHEIGGCFWESWASEYDGEVIYNRSYSPYNRCIPDHRVTTVAVVARMAYCQELTDGWICQKQDLSVMINSAGTAMSFTAEGVFTPQYRLWVSQIADYLHLDMSALSTLAPNTNYEVKK